MEVGVTDARDRPRRFKNERLGAEAAVAGAGAVVGDMSGSEACVSEAGSDPEEEECSAGAPMAVAVEEEEAAEGFLESRSSVS